MSIARHHAEWLSLVETSGPFLSMPVLLRTFPQGLDARDSERVARLREAYEEWLERKHESAVHRTWVQQVFRGLLEYPPELLVEGQAIPPGLEAAQPQFGETLRPDWVLKHRDPEGRTQLLISLYPPMQKLDGPVAGKVWKATPGTRMMELLHTTDVPLGLVTNGEHWMLVYAPRGETTGFASWYADLWMQEPITLRAFQSLLHLRRFLGVAADETLSALFAASSKDQQEVTDQLGYQVRRAVEMLVQAFDRIDAECGRQLLAGMPEKELYDSALTVMMRLVFLLSAEERKLLLLGDPLYDQHYAVSTLSELLRERADQHGEEVLEWRHDAWCRLLATFRAVYAGVQHESMRLPAYGGSLFDPDRYPFLEGRAKDTKWTNTAANPLPINNRVVLHLLEALQILRVKVPGGGPAEARRLSFRALDIEQIGHVYEGLLDHTAKRAPETILGLAGAKDKEPEIPLSRLEQLYVKGVADLIEYLHEETGKSENSLTRLLNKPPEIDDHTLLIACGQDARLLQRVKPFAGLLREDSFGQLVVIPEGSVYVTRGSDRRSTGTHYTPRSLTEPIVQYTLEPLVYVGPAEGKSKEEWQLKSPKELLELKVCDMAMGSGAFLVQACRYLAERLVEAWEKVEKDHTGTFVTTPEGELSTGSVTERLIPADAAERLAIARRTVADRCLYGVDINPMAVEMAKLSLWLITLQRDRPFTFLDHALKCGDSLLGVSSQQQIQNFSLRSGPVQTTISTVNLFRYIQDAAAKRRDLESLPSNDHSQIDTKMRLHVEAEAATAKVKALADCLMAFELRGLDGDTYEEERTIAADQVEAAMRKPLPEFHTYAREQLRGHRTFHWPVEFPEVFVRGGFDAFVGNPPFLGSKYWASAIGDYIVEYSRHILGTNPGRSDICALFHRRALALLSAVGYWGLLGTESLREGDSRAVGLDRIVEEATIYRATPTLRWPGTANVTVCVVWVAKSGYGGLVLLDGKPATAIDGHLDAVEVTQQPFTLHTSCLGAKGCDNSQGEPLILTTSHPWLTRLQAANSPFLRRYVTAEDMNNHGFADCDRWVVHTLDFSLEEVKRACSETFRFLNEYVRPERPAERLKGLPGLDNRWWQFNRPSADLYSRLRKRPTCIVIPVVSKYVLASRVPSEWVFTNKFIAFTEERKDLMSVMQSDVFRSWVQKYSGSLGGTMSVSLKWALNSFPYPRSLDAKSIARSSDIESLCRGTIANCHIGYTEIYNRFHDPDKKSADIERLRALHVDMDQAVAAAYGWSDVDLGHDFHETKQGVRFTISESARRTVLDRLLALNHQRYEEEVRTGLHEKNAKGKGIGQRGRKKAVQEDTSATQSGLFQ